MRYRSAAAAATAGAAAVLLLAPPASAATTVAAWSMNETSGRTMQDATGRYAGSIGSDVVLTGKTYRFPKPSAAYRPQHLVTVPHAAALDPGTGAWSLTTRIRYTQASGNIVQKGQSGGGAYVKLESHRGGLSCLFRGSAGSKSVSTGSKDYNDGLWHTVTCKRVGSEVSLVIDGVTRRGTAPTGAISSPRALSIGGKSSCNGTTVGCDYWVGEMDLLRIEAG